MSCVVDRRPLCFTVGSPTELTGAPPVNGIALLLLPVVLCSFSDELTVELFGKLDPDPELWSGNLSNSTRTDPNGLEAICSIST